MRFRGIQAAIASASVAVLVALPPAERRASVADSGFTSPIASHTPSSQRMYRRKAHEYTPPRYEIVDARIRRTPRSTKAHFPDDVVAVDRGGWHACALDRSGSVDCWDIDDETSYPDFAGGSEYRPRRISIAPARAIGVSRSSACALVDDNAFCWGEIDYDAHDFAPSLVATHVRALSVANDQRCMAIDDEVVCTMPAAALIQPAAGLTQTRHRVGPATQIVGDATTNCALVEGRVWCWHSAAPAHEIDLPDATAIELEYLEACATTRDGRYCWSWPPDARYGRT